MVKLGNNGVGIQEGIERKRSKTSSSGYFMSSGTLIVVPLVRTMTYRLRGENGDGIVWCCWLGGGWSEAARQAAVRRLATVLNHWSKPLDGP